MCSLVSRTAHLCSQYQYDITTPTQNGTGRMGIYVLSGPWYFSYRDVKVPRRAACRAGNFAGFARRVVEFHRGRRRASPTGRGGEAGPLLFLLLLFLVPAFIVTAEIATELLLPFTRGFLGGGERECFVRFFIGAHLRRKRTDLQHEPTTPLPTLDHFLTAVLNFFPPQIQTL